MRLMVVLGCSKSRGATFGVPLSIGIQVFGRASASRNLGLNGFESGFKEKDLKIAAELQKIDSTCKRVDSLSHFQRKMGFRGFIFWKISEATLQFMVVGVLRCVVMSRDRVLKK
ncbi:hypothetical protein PIB30_047795 [Stylosanthes scabra]|uniref:Uncharacterized protein n=1 Tax=Stylosanthes scabra TaxID=79078 RepID=A0ABU6WK83_9FABA|nr:hypothetical protein [Stylosanthes scabra]